MHETEDDRSGYESRALRRFQTFESFKGVKKISFSNGGALLVAVDYKHIHILSTYGMEELAHLPCPSQSVSGLAFNVNDTILSYCSSDGYL